MSASDAAPLPRLGEVFFDVRGNSRSMRLSWYADTGVAVFSIWQGGMCTGTFRLTIADLPRMVDTLQRGPDGQRPGWDAEAPGQAFAGDPGEGAAQVHGIGPLPGQMPPHLQAEPDYRTGVGDYLTGRPDPLSGPHDYPRGPSDPLSGSHDYPREPPDPLSGAHDYPRGPSDPLSGAHDYPRGPSDPLSGPGPYRTGARDYLADPPDRRSGSRDYLTDPQDQRTGPAEYLTGPSDYPARPPEHRTEYLADPPAPGGQDPAGYGGDFHLGSRPGSAYPGRGGSGAYPRESGHQADYPGEPAGDPYLTGAGPLDYQGEPPVPYYQGGSPASTPGDALGPSTADYPAHYGTALTDDTGDERPGDSFPYRRHRDSR